MYIKHTHTHTETISLRNKQTFDINRWLFENRYYNRSKTNHELLIMEKLTSLKVHFKQTKSEISDN